MKQVFSNTHVGPLVSVVSLDKYHCSETYFLVVIFQVVKFGGENFPQPLYFSVCIHLLRILKVKLKEKYWRNGVLDTFGSPVICAM